jgi:hypothetical protein
VRSRSHPVLREFGGGSGVGGRRIVVVGVVLRDAEEAGDPAKEAHRRRWGGSVNGSPTRLRWADVASSRSFWVYTAPCRGWKTRRSKTAHLFSFPFLTKKQIPKHFVSLLDNFLFVYYGFPSFFYMRKTWHIQVNIYIYIYMYGQFYVNLSCCHSRKSNQIAN